MKGIVKKAKAHLDSILDKDPRSDHPPAKQQQVHQQQSHMSQDGPNTISEPTCRDIFRYRYHHGTNLGSIFVLERWLHPSQFPDGASGSSELAAVQAWVNEIGLEETRKRVEERWANAMSDEDIRWLVNDAKVTTIRLPIGFYSLGPAFIENTPFAPYSHVYANSWQHICNLVRRLHEASIGTLIDLHALPGGANAEEHSGTNSGTAHFWAYSENRLLGIRCAEFIAQQVTGGLDGITGIQIVNEAVWESDRMYEWYDNCVSAISAIDPSIPVIISDGWNLGKAVEYSLQKNSVISSRPISPVIIDTHYYWAFSDKHKAMSPQDIVADVNTKLSELDGKEGSVIDRGAVQIIVGEYSCVLTEDSWAKRGDTPKEALVNQFGQAQSQKWQQRSGGSFFWTLKMDWLPGGEWGFYAQVQNRSIIPPKVSTIGTGDIGPIATKAYEGWESRMRAATDGHCAYWDQVAPGGSFEHWRYEYGWKIGFHDALAFFQGKPGVSGGNKIGNVEIWALKRLRESGFRGGFVWEFEQGLRKGIQDFHSIAGI
ncbi:glycoside hydrolase [Lojkania enalia]|uniref:Glycoside hydrolase n=1 Tax=Lojkania enalia TaxID=147567 RepID=A0A9P4N4L8_9PLEO|nr:glycoside hydrolase [Didymosphaeria enalia]